MNLLICTINILTVNRKRPRLEASKELIVPDWREKRKTSLRYCMKHDIGA